MGRFFNYEGQFFQALEKIADIIVLNFLFIISCVPIVTIGASLTATYTVAMKATNDENVYIGKEFLKVFKENFKQSTIIWLILCVIGIFIGIDFYICRFIPGFIISNIIRFACTLAGIILGFIIIYVFPIISKFENTIKNTMINAILISIQNLPYTLIMLIVSLLPIGCLILFSNYWGQIIFFDTVIAYGIVAYINSILLNKVLSKYIK